MKYTVTVGGQSFEIEVDHDRLVWVDGRPLYVDLEQIGGLPVYSLALDEAGYVLFVERGQGEYQVEVQGQIYPVEVKRQRPQLALRHSECADGGNGCLILGAPLAGHLLSLKVGIGDSVETGQVIAIIESMKMKMELKAPEAGVVEAVHVPPEHIIAQGEALVTLRVG